MRTEQPKESCPTGCGSTELERNRYFTGKYMTARDFRGEQEYFLSRHRLHNRLFHGWGIVCGLEVVPHKDPACQDRWVVVCPGIAIDCCGRELILDKKTPLEIWRPPKQEPTEEIEPEPDETTQASTATQAGPVQENEKNADEEGNNESQRDGFLLFLHYVEKEIERVPALYAEGTCDPTRQEANRVREVACLAVSRWEDIENSGWRDSEVDPQTRCRDDCADSIPGPQGVCLEPECPSKHMVPLALITPQAIEEGNEIEYRIDEEEIDTSGRRQLNPPANFLTHIVAINWPHGGELSLSELRSLDGRLEIWFDRKLRPSDGDATGINEQTLVAQYGGAQRDIEFLPYESESPPALEDECRAVLTIDPDYLSGRQTIVGNVIYVTLKCDFVLDCHDNPVDGDHLGGVLPSGNGIRGGVFESWFRVVTDDEAYREEV